MADMAVFQALHAPQIGILCAGGHFTMDRRRAAFAAKTYFQFETVIPCHYGTFPIIAPNADAFVAEMSGQNVLVPQVGAAFEA